MRTKEEKILLAALIEMLAEFDSADDLGATLLVPSKAVKQARAAYKEITGHEWDPIRGNYAPKV